MSMTSIASSPRTGCGFSDRDVGADDIRPDVRDLPAEPPLGRTNEPVFPLSALKSVEACKQRTHCCHLEQVQA